MMADISVGRQFGNYMALPYPTSVLVLKGMEASTLGETDLMRSLHEAPIPLLVWDSTGTLAPAGWRSRRALGPIAACAWGQEAGLFDPITAPWLPESGRESYLNHVASHLVPPPMQPFLMDILAGLLDAPEEMAWLLTEREGFGSLALLPAIAAAFGEAAASGKGLNIAQRLAGAGLAGNLVRRLVFDPQFKSGAVLADLAKVLAPLRWQEARESYGDLDLDMLQHGGATTAYVTHQDSLGAKFAQLALSIMLDRVPKVPGTCRAALVIDLEDGLDGIEGLHRIVSACRFLGVSVTLSVSSVAAIRRLGFETPAAMFALFDAVLCLGTVDVETLAWLDGPSERLPSVWQRNRHRIQRLMPFIRSDRSVAACIDGLGHGQGLLLPTQQPIAATTLQVA
jgi:hypothetical protein